METDKMETAQKENIWNIPNFVTALRVVSTFLFIGLVFAGWNIKYLVGIFVFGMITDLLDGQIARRFKMTTEFGRKFDMAADRLLMLGVALALVIKFTITGVFTTYHLAQVFLMLSREIITTPFAIAGIISGRAFPQVRFSGKLTTFLQAFTFPMIVLSPFFPFFNFSIYFSFLVCAVGLVAGGNYIRDVISQKNN